MSDSGSGADSGPHAPLEALSAALSSVAGRVAESIVAVHSRCARSSGFAWRPDLLVTAHEALADDGGIAVLRPGGATAKATLVGRDPATDIALLQVDGAGLRPLTLEKAAVLPGALALAVGSQEGASLVGLGIVSLVGPPWRSLRGGEIDARIELDVSLRHQAEGGVAVDAAGRAFGMTAFGPRRRVLVIPAQTIERVAAKLASHGRVPRGYLGLALQPVRLDDGGTGAMVMSVEAGGPGAAAGIRQGDVIVAWNGHPIASVSEILRVLGPESVGMTVTLSLKRAGAPLDVRLTIGERPQR